MTATKPTLPKFEGADVSRAAVKFSGVGTGLSDGLSVAPIALEPGDEKYFILRSRCVGVSHDEDKHELLVRVHKLRTVDMAPIDGETAEKALQEYAEEIERRKAEVDGQLRLDEEEAAVAAERLDETGSVSEIADAAKKRANGQPG